MVFKAMENEFDFQTFMMTNPQCQCFSSSFLVLIFETGDFPSISFTGILSDLSLP